MPPATQFYKPLALPTYDVEAAKAAVAASGLTGDDLKVQLWYPSDVARPYMPDPKGLAEAIASDLEAVGFTVEFQSAGWRTGYLADEALGKYPAWLLGWTCDWPGPDNFLNTAFFHFDGDEPNPEFAYGPPELKAAFDKAASAPDDATAQAAWDEAQDHPGARHPHRPARPLEAAGRSVAAVKGFLGAGNLNEPLYSVWLDK